MSHESKDKISFDNFNYISKNSRLTSPLSIQSCKLKGVTEEDLIYITLEEYIQSHPECLNLPKEFQQERYDNYEQNRKDLIETLKELRNELKEANSKKEQNEKMEKEDYNDENISTQNKGNNLTNDELKKKLKDEMEDNIKNQIEKEFEKQERRKRKINSEKYDERSKSNKLKTSEIFLKDKTDRQLKNEIINKNRLNILDKKQKDYLIKEEKRKKHLEYMRNEISKKRNEEYQLKKTKIALALTQNEEKMKEKLKTFYKKKQEKEERIEKREKERLDELKNKYLEDNKKKIRKITSSYIKK